MRRFETTYQIKYKTAESDYFSIWNGSYRMVENAMKKVEELKNQGNVTDIILKDRKTYRPIYKFDRGFEVFYYIGGK